MRALMIIAILLPLSLFAVSSSAVVTIIVTNKRNKAKAAKKKEDESEQNEDDNPKEQTDKMDQITSEDEGTNIPTGESDIL